MKLFQKEIWLRGRLAIAPCLLALAAVPFLISSAAAGQAAPPRLRRAPDFTLFDSDGKKHVLSEHRGRVVVLQFFQIGCPTCQAEAPVLEELQKKFKSKGIDFLAISHDQSGAEGLRQFAEKYKISYPLLVGDLEVAVRFLGLNPQRTDFQVPQFFVINREGQITHEFHPARDAEFFRDFKLGLEQALDALVGSPPDTRRTQKT